MTYLFALERRRSSFPMAHNVAVKPGDPFLCCSILNVYTGNQGNSLCRKVASASDTMKAIVLVPNALSFCNGEQQWLSELVTDYPYFGPHEPENTDSKTRTIIFVDIKTFTTHKRA